VEIPKICQAHSCIVEIEESKAFCSYHWGMLPKVVQLKLYDSYLPGSIRGEWQKILSEARAVISNLEGRPS
jgi:hypothetical protein